MTRLYWKEDFASKILTGLPQLGIALQWARFYRPPDADPNAFELSWDSWFPLDEADAVWQVQLTVLPLFDQWFDDIKGRDFPEDLSPEAAYRSLQGVEEWPSSYQVQAAFSTTAYLALMGKALPYGEVILRLLMDPQWGSIINTAACIGLLYLGDLNVPYRKLLGVFRESTVDWDMDWESAYQRDHRKNRYYEPDGLPDFYWSSVLDNLGDALHIEEPLLQSLYSYAIEKDNALSNLIYRQTVKSRQFTPLSVTSFLARGCKLPEDAHHLQAALAMPGFETRHPELARRLQFVLARRDHS